MLPLELRQEFRSSFMRGTAIELRNKQNTGWAQRKTTDLLRITYPTADVYRALEAVSLGAAGRPILLQGHRGRGKSHIMALLHHAFHAPEIVEGWAGEWAERLHAHNLDARRLANLVLQRNFRPLTETLSDQEYPTLQDVIFSLHPRGMYYRGKFEQAGQLVPAKSLLRDLFAEQPTALILDEFQTWFDGLHDEPGDHGRKRRHWAFNFIQTLSELAVERPDLLVLIISVRDSSTEAYKQIWRVGPLIVDFKGETAKDDRKRLVLHRLFENRANFANTDIAREVAVYAAERNRLLFHDKTETDKARLTQEVVECWPFSPELLSLLEDQILMAPAAQETRDLIRILAEIFRARGGKAPLITAADFDIGDEAGAASSLLDAVATTADQERLRETAKRNLQAVQQTDLHLPHARAVITSVWMRSLATTNLMGGTRAELQLDLTREAPVDDNLFTAELNDVLDNSFNIHEVGTQDKRFCFKLEENPLAKLKASARNDKLFESKAPATPGLLTVRRDQDFLRKALNSLLRPADSVAEPPSRPIVLDPNWEQAPWANLPQQDLPPHWDKQVLIVVPVSLALAVFPERMGPWLATHVAFNRNMVRFLLQKQELHPLFEDRDLLLLARCTLLAKEWKDTEAGYGALHNRFKRELEKALSARFDTYALLNHWNFQTPAACVFHLEAHKATAGNIPAAIEKHIRENFFAPEDFESFIVLCARRNETMKQVLALLRDPPASPEQEVLPYLGESTIYEQVLRVASQDRIILNVNGTWHRREAGQSEEEALRTLKQRTFRTGRELHDIQLGDPAQVAGAGFTVAPTPIKIDPGNKDTPLKVPVPGPSPLRPTLAGKDEAAAGFTEDQEPDVLVPVPAPVIRRSLGPRTGIHLLSDLEKWAFPESQKVSQATLTMTGITIKQLRELCLKFPPKLAAELQVILPPEGVQT